jgi:dTDP-4-dehydrorhamnose reductase
VNRDGPENLAKACETAGIPLFHVSTDYVFDGCKEVPYVETDSIAPLGVYGTSKWVGEEAVRKCCPQHIILRTSWVFSSHGNNFVKTMLRLGVEREELGVVADQVGKPTSAGELARVILEILPAAGDYWGTYHIAQPDVTSWHGFADAIFDEARSQGYRMKLKKLNAIGTVDYPTAARRPANSELNCDKLERTFGVNIKPWRESMKEVIREMMGAKCEAKDGDDEIHASRICHCTN